MRSAAQISRTVDEYRDHMTHERREHLRVALGMIRAARDRGEEWVIWLDAGRPAYTPDQYRAVEAARKREKASAPPRSA